MIKLKDLIKEYTYLELYWMDKNGKLIKVSKHLSYAEQYTKKYDRDHFKNSNVFISYIININ